MFRRFSVALAALALVPAPAFAKLAPAETRMVQTVDAEQERTLAMLEKWVNQNSGSLNIEGVATAGPFGTNA
jgi:glutamate carboxypeptidase